MSFSRRRIDVSFRIAGPNSIPGATGNTLIAKGLRVHATISKPGMVPGIAQVRIYGLSLSAMNQLSTIGIVRQAANGNEITISAGDDNGTSVCFQGQINECYADLNESPDSPLVVHAQTGLLNQLAPAQATSYAGSVDAAQVLAYLASASSPILQLENNGVAGIMLSNPYYP
ncbi:MAG: baseplate hub protein, partial [Janthinobacterium lividum]